MASSVFVIQTLKPSDFRHKRNRRVLACCGSAPIPGEHESVLKNTGYNPVATRLKIAEKKGGG